MPVRGEAPKRGTGAPVYHVGAPESREEWDVTILDEMVLGLRCHWVERSGEKRQSRRCEALSAAGCRWCQARDRKLWQGFLAVWNHGSSRREVLRIGEESSAGVAALYHPERGLRGVRVVVRRATSGATGRLEFQRTRAEPLTPLPDAHSLRHTLRVVLGTQDVPDQRCPAVDLVDEPPAEGGGS